MREKVVASSRYRGPIPYGILALLNDIVTVDTITHAVMTVRAEGDGFNWRVTVLTDRLLADVNGHTVDGVTIDAVGRAWPLSRVVQVRLDDFEVRDEGFGGADTRGRWTFSFSNDLPELDLTTRGSRDSMFRNAVEVFAREVCARLT